MQKTDKKGPLNHQYGKKKSLETILKLRKTIYVYNAETMESLGEFGTTECYRHFKMGSDTIVKYAKSNKPFKGKVFSYIKLTNASE